MRVLQNFILLFPLGADSAGHVHRNKPKTVPGLKGTFRLKAFSLIKKNSFGILNLVQGTDGVNAPPCISCRHSTLNKTAAALLARVVLIKLI